MPELHSAATRSADANAADLLRRAHRLIAVSESTKRDAVRVLGIPPERITVIHSGISRAFFEIDAAAGGERARALPAEAAVRLRARHHRAAQEHQGCSSPRFEALPPSLREQFDLVLAGPMGWADAQTSALVRDSGDRALSGIHPGSRSCAADRGGDGVRVSLALRRLRISAGSGDGGGRGVGYIERFVSAGDRGRCGAACRSAQPHRTARCRSNGCYSRLRCARNSRPRAESARRQFTWENTAALSLRFFEEAAG